MRLSLCDSIGGRTRTRTLDPLIKSLPSDADIARHFFKPSLKWLSMYQMIMPEIQTAPSHLKERAMPIEAKPVIK
jgi:hypothetical protein